MQVVMQTLKQGFNEPELGSNLVSDLVQNWYLRLSIDYPEQSADTRESIIRWLQGEFEQFEMLNLESQSIQQAMEYRYRILRQRYLGLEPEQAYRNLITQLGSIVLHRAQIRTWVAHKRNRASAIVDVLQAVIQELLHSDRYMQQQIAWIAKTTNNPTLRNALLLASLEEYCLRPIRKQPLLVYRLINHLRHI